MHQSSQKVKKSDGRRKGNFHLPEIVPCLLWGLLSGMLVFALLLSLSAVAIVKIGLGEKEITVVFIACCSIAAAVGGFVCARKPRKNGILMGLAGSAPLLVILIAAVLLVNGGIAGNNMAIMIPLVLVFGICGGVMAVNMKKRVK